MPDEAPVQTPAPELAKPVDEGVDFALLDAEDEVQILNDLRGIPTDKFLYKNKRGEWELSYSGTKWAVRKLAERGWAIRIDGQPYIKQCPLSAEHIIVTVGAQCVKLDKDGRETKLDSCFGSYRGWSNQKINSTNIAPDFNVVPDEHFFVKAVAKATKNVQQALMPVEFKRAMIAEILNPPPQPAKPEPEKKASKTPPRGAPKETDDASVARQKAMTAFRLVVNDDIEKCRVFLKAWTGKDKTHDIDAKTLGAITSALYKVKEGSATFDMNGIVDKISGAILVGKVSSTGAATASEKDGEMF